MKDHSHCVHCELATLNSVKRSLLKAIARIHAHDGWSIRHSQPKGQRSNRSMKKLTHPSGIIFFLIFVINTCNLNRKKWIECEKSLWQKTNAREIMLEKFAIKARMWGRLHTSQILQTVLLHVSVVTCANFCTFCILHLKYCTVPWYRRTQQNVEVEKARWALAYGTEQRLYAIWWPGSTCRPEKASVKSSAISVDLRKMKRIVETNLIYFTVSLVMVFLLALFLSMYMLFTFSHFSLFLLHFTFTRFSPFLHWLFYSRGALQSVICIFAHRMWLVPCRISNIAAFDCDDER